jgi:hypothetical protein
MFWLHEYSDPRGARKREGYGGARRSDSAGRATERSEGPLARRGPTPATPGRAAKGARPTSKKREKKNLMDKSVVKTARPRKIPIGFQPNSLSNVLYLHTHSWGKENPSKILGL